MRTFFHIFSDPTLVSSDVSPDLVHFTWEKKFQDPAWKYKLTPWILRLKQGRRAGFQLYFVMQTFTIFSVESTSLSTDILYYTQSEEIIRSSVKMGRKKRSSVAQPHGLKDKIWGSSHFLRRISTDSMLPTTPYSHFQGSLLLEILGISATNEVAFQFFHWWLKIQFSHVNYISFYSSSTLQLPLFFLSTLFILANLCFLVLTPFRVSVGFQKWEQGNIVFNIPPFTRTF